MQPQFQVGDHVNHKFVPCKQEGRVEAVIERTVYNIYRVRWCGCVGDYYENELVSVVNSVSPSEMENG
jgi:hypothetical protein